MDETLPNGHLTLQALIAATQRSTPPSIKDIVDVASDPGLRAMLVDLLSRPGDGNASLRATIEHIEAVAEAVDERLDMTEALIELLDRTGLPIATAAVISGIGLLISMGTKVGPITIFIAGGIGLLVSGTARTVLRLRASRNRLLTKKLRRLSNQLGALI